MQEYIGIVRELHWNATWRTPLGRRNEAKKLRQQTAFWSFAKLTSAPAVALAHRGDGPCRVPMAI